MTNSVSLSLRDYQKECLKAIYARYQAGIRRQLICLPTGTGKTVIFAAFPSFFKMKKRLLVLAHREELLEQARAKIMAANPGLRVEIEQAGQSAGAESNVVIASVPTLGREHSARLARLNPEQFFLVVVDEAHHAAAPTYQRVLKHFGVFEEKTPKLLVGFTATPRRGDGTGLEATFQEISFSRGLPEMTEAGYLSPLIGYRVETAIDLSGVRIRHGDFVPGGLSEAVNVAPRNDLVVKVYQDHLRQRPTLCFCVDVAHARDQAESFRKAGIPAASVTGEMDGPERRQVLEDFRSGKLAVLTNCQVLTEGYDESSISGILLARPTKSALLYTQMIGRSTRLHPGKANAAIIDIVDLSKAHRLVTLPTLFGLPERFNLNGSSTAEVQHALRWAGEHRPWVRADLATSLEDLRYRCQRIDLFDLALPEELSSQSEMAWTACGQQHYQLSLPNRSSFHLAQNILGKWEVVLREQQVESVLSAHSHSEAALEWAEDYVRKRIPDALGLVLRCTSWRTQPATEKQLELLRKKKLKIPDRLTRGQASHLISTLMDTKPSSRSR